jgi:hypothetical protein
METLEKVLMIIGMMVVIVLVYDFVFWKYLLCYRRDKLLRGLGLDEMVKGGLRYSREIEEMVKDQGKDNLVKLRDIIVKWEKEANDIVNSWEGIYKAKLEEFTEKEKKMLDIKIDAGLLSIFNAIQNQKREVDARLSDDVIIKLVENQIKDALFKIEQSIIQLDNISRTRIEDGVKEVQVFGESQYKHIQNILNKNYERDAAVRKEAFERSVARLEEMVIKAVKEHLNVDVKANGLIDPEYLDNNGKKLNQENDPERTEQPEQVKPMYTIDDLANQKLAVHIKHSDELNAFGIKTTPPSGNCNFYASIFAKSNNWKYCSKEFLLNNGYTVIEFEQVILPEKDLNENDLKNNTDNE